MEKFIGSRWRPRLLGIFLPALLLSSASTQAVSLLEAIEGTSSTVHFYGGLLTSPCSLTPDSQDQAIDLGEIKARAFLNAGDQSLPVRFRLSFRNCLLGGVPWWTTQTGSVMQKPRAFTCRVNTRPRCCSSATATCITQNY